MFSIPKNMSPVMTLINCKTIKCSDTSELSSLLLVNLSLCMIFIAFQITPCIELQLSYTYVVCTNIYTYLYMNAPVYALLVSSVFVSAYNTNFLIVLIFHSCHFLSLFYSHLKSELNLWLVLVCAKVIVCL